MREQGKEYFYYFYSDPEEIGGQKAEDESYRY